MLTELRTGAPEREVALSLPAGPAADEALRRAGFAPSHTPLVWRGATGGDPALDGAVLLDALRAEMVPAWAKVLDVDPGSREDAIIDAVGRR